jgi:2'-5' RNA ligase
VRVFVALDLDAALRDGAAALVDALRAHVSPKLRAKWCAPEVMHVTVRFFGDVEDERLAALASLVEHVPLSARAPLVRVTQLAGFPEPRSARVLVAPVADDGTVAAMAAAVENGAASLGFAPEDRGYHPHVTLARLKRPVDVRRLFAEVPVSLAGGLSALTLYRSVLGDAGPTYTALTTRPLAAPSVTPP